MILYSYITFPSPLPERQFQQLLLRIPPPMRNRVLRYRRWEDRHNALFGKLLLGRLLKVLGLPEQRLNQLSENAYGKPFAGPDVEFNISHSGALVACAVSSREQLGIDVEKKVAVQPESIRCFLRPDEWALLKRNPTPEQFFDFWTKKESLLKAKGMGLNLDLRNVHISRDTGTLFLGGRQEVWHYYPLPVDPRYVATLCTRKAGLPLQFITARDLLNIYFTSSPILELPL